VDVPYHIYERLLIMWEAVEYASILGYPEAMELAQSDTSTASDAGAEQALLVGAIKNTVLMRVVRFHLISPSLPYVYIPPYRLYTPLSFYLRYSRIVFSLG
jgi:hypothetical protein